MINNWTVESSGNVYLNFKGEVFLQVLDDHDEEGKFDAQGLLGISRTCDVGCAG